MSEDKTLVTFVGGELDMQRHSLPNVHNNMIYRNRIHQVLCAGIPDLSKVQTCAVEEEEYETVRWVTKAGTTVWIGFYND